MPEQKGRIGFLALSRAVACLLVVYCHLIGYKAGPDWLIQPYIDNFIGDPLAIIWHFGFIGVALFFLISGFIITHVAQRETREEFAIKRFFRVYPPFLVALTVALLLADRVNGSWAPMSPSAILREASLFGSEYKVLAPSYTLTIEIMFYALATLLLPIFRTRPIVATTIIAVLPVAVRFTVLDPVLASGVKPLATLVSYQSFLSIFAIGMAIYYGWTGRITVKLVVALIAVAWCSLVWTSGPSGQGFQVSTLYAALIFLSALWASPSVRSDSAVAAISEGSYSLYLLHVPIGLSIINGLEPTCGYTLALIVSLVTLAGTCWISYTYIEKPSQAAGRLLIKHLRRVGMKAAAPATA